MNEFRAGDRVRELHGSDEGTVQTVLKQSRLIVLWDSFGDETEVPAKDVVKIHSAEELHFRKTGIQKLVTQPEENTQAPVRRIGNVPFLALCLAGSTQEHELWLQNPYNYELSFNLFLKIRGKVMPFRSGKAGPGQKLMLGKVGQTEFRFLNGFVFQSLAWADTGTFKPKEPIHLELKFHSGMGREPIRELGRDGIRIDVAAEVEAPLAPKENTLNIKEELLPEEIDLHIEKLVENPSKMNPAEMLDLQVRTLNRYLDRAIQANLKKVIIIHGVGTGALRLEVLRRLDEHEFVKEYRPASMLKYGSGATEVWLE